MTLCLNHSTENLIAFSHTWIFDPCLSSEPAVHVFMITTGPLKEQPFQLANPHYRVSKIVVEENTNIINISGLILTTLKPLI